MRHLFLTGEIQVGKSTLIRRVLAAHPEWRVGGFKTVTRWEGARGFVHLLPASAGMEACAPNNQVGLRGPAAQRPAGFAQAFDRLGPPLLAEASADLILMDELGFMERESHRFCAAVLRTLDGPTPVLGVVKPRASELLDAVRAHPEVEVWQVTPQNREALFARLEAAVLRRVGAPGEAKKAKKAAL